MTIPLGDYINALLVVQVVEWKVKERFDRSRWDELKRESGASGKR